MINFPNFSNILSRLRSDFQSSNPDSNPFLKTGFLKAILDSFAGRFNDLFQTLKEVLKQSFASTATDEFLLRIGNERGITSKVAQKSTGQIAITGVLTTDIPNGNQMVSSTGALFTTQESGIITAQVVSVSNLVQSGGIATATTADHELTNGNNVTISGADQVDYNGTFEIIAIDKDIFTYEVPAGTTSPATGTISLTINRSIVNIESSEGGSDTNLEANEKLDFVSTISDIDSQVGIIFNGLTGGTDDETEDEYRVRLLDIIREPVAPFNEANIDNNIQENVPTATRIFIQSVTPDAGQVTIYFVEDGQANILPSSANLTTAKEGLEDIRPAQIDPADIFVLAPTLVSQDFTFSSITPDTTTMREAIIENLKFLFNKSAVGITIKEEEYINIILNSIDTITGATLTDFTLSSPSGDLTYTSSQLGVLGDVNF